MIRISPLLVSLTLCSSAWASQSIRFTLDFESGDLDGWTTTGSAFSHQPTKGDNPTARHRGQPSKHQGDFWIGSYEKYRGKAGEKPGATQGDGPTGTLTSRKFTIPDGELSFLIGGGSGNGTRVELLAKGKAVLKASGKNTETMARVVWDLAPFAGQSGQLRIVDEASGGWGHINVDDFVFSAGVAGGDLTGTYKCNDGGTYFVRQVGNEIWWYGRSANMGKSWSNVFHGVRKGVVVNGKWSDIPQGGASSHGDMTFRIEGTGLKAQTKTGGFGGSSWTRKK